jgi:hypothetical protein
MFRIGVTIVLPLLLPTGLYLLWIMVRRAPREQGARSWAALPWPWLVGAGILLLVTVLFGITVGFGTAKRGLYVAPQWLNGRIVPGHIVPPPR